MKTVILISFLLLGTFVQSQSARDYAVEANATITPGEDIMLKWLPDPAASNYLIYRKLKGDGSWGTVLANLPATDSTYLDTNIQKGIAYEYRIIKGATAYSGYGYVASGIDLAPLDSRGRILVIIDSTHRAYLQNALDQYKLDLIGDGWIPEFYYTDPAESVINIKNYIKGVKQQHADLSALFLIGHVPVPYSGEIYPDGHTNHEGAWPADVYYGVLGGTWTDISVNNITASGTRNDNIPGDGKFDQSLLPDDMELQVGRIDFHDLPNFSVPEEDLLLRYLERDHAYRVKDIDPDYRAVVDDNFGGFGGEAFAANAWKNFPPLLGFNKTVSGDYRTTLNGNSHIWSYGCGGGSFTSCSGVGTSANFAGDSLQTIFTMLFGSYFGDWDVSNNLMRTALAQGTTLAICWAGRPHWQFHHMGMGESIGYGARLSQNNTNLYHASYGARFIHMSLLGDPTLRMYVLAPPELAMAAVNGHTAYLSWKASTDTILGYHVYRSDKLEGPYHQISGIVVTDTVFTDSCMVSPGTYYYNIRAIRLETTPSGSFYNLSQGTLTQVTSTDTFKIKADFQFHIINDSVYFTNNSKNAYTYNWSFGDGHTSTDTAPAYQWNESGEYVVSLIAGNGCETDTIEQMVYFAFTWAYDLTNHLFLVYPNPVSQHLYVAWTGSPVQQLSLYNMAGIGMPVNYQLENAHLILDIRALPAGLYLLRLTDTSGREEMIKVVVNSRGMR